MLEIIPASGADDDESVQFVFSPILPDSYRTYSIISPGWQSCSTFFHEAALT
jgi:hypothetical protein